MANHSTPGYDIRGSSHDRRRRRAWLVSEAAGFGGNGRTVQCYHGCGAKLTVSSLEVDRFPVCGHDGGRYTRDNIVPACRSCNLFRCDGCRGARAANDGLHPRETGYVAGESEYEDA